jgi:hypothetical protein
MQEVTGAVASAEITEEQTESKTEEQWDDEALAATYTRKGAATTGSELRDMKSLDPKRSDKGFIAEKLRVEETKAQLAAAREGMEREAAKLKEDAEKKDEKKAATSSGGTRFGAAAASMSGAGGTGGKWVPPHLRGGSSAGLTRSRMPGASGGFQKVDTKNEELFPDLAAADKILEKQQKQQQPVFKIPKKTPVGGGATWASKPKPVPQKAPKAEPKVVEAPVEKKEEPIKAVAPAPAADGSATKPVIKKRTTTKKKKDLSTFKPGSS